MPPTEFLQLAANRYSFPPPLKIVNSPAASATILILRDRLAVRYQSSSGIAYGCDNPHAPTLSKRDHAVKEPAATRQHRWGCRRLPPSLMPRPKTPLTATISRNPNNLHEIS